MFHTYTLFPFTDDDAFITYRYARNFVNGYGLVYNRGEKVEGYTNFTWTILISAIIKIGLDPVIPSKLIGIIFSIGIMFMTYLFSQLISGDRKALHIIAPMLLASSSSFAAWAGWGLETAAYSFFVVLAFYLFTREFILDKKTYHLSGIIFFLASITRPEGAIMFGLAFFYIFISDFSRFKKIENISKKLIFLGSFIIPFLIYFIWRWNYYGYPLPNTYYVRMGMTLPTLIPQFKRGIFYFSDFILKYGGWCMIFSLILFKRKQKKVIYLLSYITLMSILYIVYVGGDSKQFFRLLVPFMPFYYLLAQEGLIEFKSKIRLSKNALKSLTPYIVYTIVTLFFMCNYLPTLWFFGLPLYKDLPLSRIILGKTPNFEGILWDRENQKRIGLYFKDHLPSNSSVAVITAGTVPYYSELKTIDMLGVNEPYIAHQEVVTNKELNQQLGNVLPEEDEMDIKLKLILIAAHQKIDLEYVLSKNPTILFHGDPVLLKKHGYIKFDLVTDNFSISYWAKENPFI